MYFIFYFIILYFIFFILLLFLFFIMYFIFILLLLFFYIILWLFCFYYTLNFIFSRIETVFSCFQSNSYKVDKISYNFQKIDLCIMFSSIFCTIHSQICKRLIEKWLFLSHWSLFPLPYIYFFTSFWPVLPDKAKYVWLL